MDTPPPTRSGTGPEQRRDSSRLYEMNIWMWRYGRARGRPRTMVSIAKGERIRAERLSESKIRAAETRKRRSEAAAAAGAAEACPKEAADRIEHLPMIS